MHDLSPAFVFHFFFGANSKGAGLCKNFRSRAKHRSERRLSYNPLFHCTSSRQTFFSWDHRTISW